MCQECEQHSQRIQELIPLGYSEFVPGQPLYMIQESCVAAAACGGGDTRTLFYDDKEAFLELISLLPYFFGDVRNTCEQLSTIHQQVGSLCDEYRAGKRTSGQLVEQLNPILRPTDIGIEVLGTVDEVCSSPEPVFATFRKEARSDLEKTNDPAYDASQPFEPNEVEAFVHWINGEVDPEMGLFWLEDE